jgi:hypothetical protein
MADVTKASMSRKAPFPGNTGRRRGVSRQKKRGGRRY